MDQQNPRDAGLRHEAEPKEQFQAAREQSIERLQDEVDTADVDVEPREPKDALRLTDQQRMFDLTNRRIPHA